jgi:DNA-binding MarR family transcriptional regulator
LIISITDKGRKLKEKAINVPEEIGKCVKLSREEVEILYKTLYKILDTFKED